MPGEVVMFKACVGSVLPKFVFDDILKHVKNMTYQKIWNYLLICIEGA